MRELIRSFEGVIDRAAFRKGALFVGLLTLIVFGLAAVTAWAGSGMAWMTVSIAPFLGGVLFFAASSVLYFWYCLFAKRLRGMAQSPALLYGFYIALLIAAIAGLIAYQDRALGLQLGGFLAYGGEIGTVFSLLAGIAFCLLLGMGLFGPDRAVGAGNCFPTPGEPEKGSEPERRS